jgi:hypothetical protein
LVVLPDVLLGRRDHSIAARISTACEFLNCQLPAGQISLAVAKLVNVDALAKVSAELCSVVGCGG